MKYSCEKDSSLCSAHLTSPCVLGCSSWSSGSSSGSDMQQQSSISQSLTLKMSFLPQQCHKTKPLSFQFQDQDSSSTQSTDQSYLEVGSAQSGQISYSNSSACSTPGKIGGKSVEGLIRSSAGSQDFTFPPSQLDHNQSLAPIAFHHAKPCFSGLLAAPYGPQHNGDKIRKRNYWRRWIMPPVQVSNVTTPQTVGELAEKVQSIALETANNDAAAGALDVSQSRPFRDLTSSQYLLSTSEGTGRVGIQVSDHTISARN